MLDIHNSQAKIRSTSAGRILADSYSSCTDDVLFHWQKLYGINYNEEVFVFNVEQNHEGHRTVSDPRFVRIGKQAPRENWSDYETLPYLIELPGTNKMLLVVRYLGGDLAASTAMCKVYELDCSSTPFMWVEKTSLDGHVIFLSGSCSYTIPACRHAGLHEDRIYFSHDIRALHYYRSSIFSSPDTGFFSPKNSSITKLTKSNCKNNLLKLPPMWVFLSNQF